MNLKTENEWLGVMKTTVTTTTASTKKIKTHFFLIQIIISVFSSPRPTLSSLFCPSYFFLSFSPTTFISYWQPGIMHGVEIKEDLSPLERRENNNKILKVAEFQERLRDRKLKVPLQTQPEERPGLENLI